MIEYAVVDPATGQKVKTYPTISDEDLQAAIGRAHEAHRSWNASTTIEDRAALIGRVAELHTERREELANIIVREMGKPIEQALGEVDFCVAIYEFYADNALELLADEPIKLLDGEGSAFVRKSSYGVLLGIMPWNYPYYQVARFAGPNLVIGNTVLLKHAPQCPESAAAMEQIFHDAGVPATRTSTSTPPRAGRVDHRRPARARRLADRLRARGRGGRRDRRAPPQEGRARARRVGPVHPARHAGPRQARRAGRGRAAGELGQACNAAKRFIVVDELYDEFLERFTKALTAVQPGDPHSPETTVGPLSSAGPPSGSRTRSARGRPGRKLVAGGTREGNFFATTVLTDVRPTTTPTTRSSSGPVAQVYRVADEDEAVRLANDTPYGLGSYVITDDDEQALRVADQIDAGMVFVNVVGAEGAELPFGGVKNSGYGRELGRYGLDEFVNKKLIRVGG
jgi:succinate-semialdehyde dehydrogenase/glutarate-semialdehyde dehydrogenase